MWAKPGTNLVNHARPQGQVSTDHILVLKARVVTQAHRWQSSKSKRALKPDMLSSETQVALFGVQTLISGMSVD